MANFYYFEKSLFNCYISLRYHRHRHRPSTLPSLLATL
ncbi:MAG: hypothetical protein ACI9WN_000405, partial [Porticoccus sp.]